MAGVEYFDEKVERASRDEIGNLQFKKLASLLKKVYTSNAFYRKKLDLLGISFSEIRSIDDLHKLPFTTKGEFEEDQKQHPPFGSNLTEPLENYVQYHQTSGTTGEPLKFLDTKESWEWRGRVACYILKAAGVGKGDRILFPFNFGPYTAFWVIYEAAYRLGALIIPTGGWNSLQRLECIIENQVTVIPTTPTYALALAKAAEETGVDLASSTVRVLSLSGEPGALIPDFRQRIQKLWNADCFEYIGMTEVGTWAFQCSEEPNGVHINESEFIAEVVDPQTGTPVEVGQIGELILTNLGRSCMPAIRYRTGDLGRVQKGVCGCGRTFSVLEGGVLGRKDEMITIRGVNVFPSAIANIIQSHIEPGDHYQIEVYEKKGISEIAIKLESKEKVQREAIEKAIQGEIRSKFNLRVEVKSLPIGTFPKSDYKAKRFVDKRKENVAR
jgi:phenylacetate-CoA ligase